VSFPLLAPGWRRCLAEHASHVVGCVIEKLESVGALDTADLEFLGGRLEVGKLRRDAVHFPLLAPRWRRCLAEHASRAIGRIVEKLEPVKALEVNAGLELWGGRHDLEIHGDVGWRVWRLGWR
jgi:hypothetical protein